MSKRKKVVVLGVLIVIVLCCIVAGLLLPVGRQVTPEQCAAYGFRVGFAEGHNRGYKQAECDYAIPPDPNQPS